MHDCPLLFGPKNTVVHIGIVSIHHFGPCSLRRHIRHEEIGPIEALQAALLVVIWPNAAKEKLPISRSRSFYCGFVC